MNENNRIQIKFEFIEEFDGNISFKEAAKRIFDKLNVRSIYICQFNNNL